MSEPTSEISQFIQTGELSDVRFFEVFGKVLDDEREDIPEDEFVHGLTVRIGREPGFVEVRVDMTVETAHADYRVTAATQYHYQPVEFQVSEPLGREFAERVGVMAVYPYVREAFASLARRLGQPPVTLPLMRAGELSLGEPTQPVSDANAVDAGGSS